MPKWTRACACALWIAGPGLATAADIRVLSTPTFKTSLEDLKPAFERASGHRLIFAFDSVATLQRRIREGEAFDVAVLLPPAIDELVKTGSVSAASVTVVASAGIGVAMRAGVAHGPLTSVDDLKRLLADTASYAYSIDSASGAFFVQLLDALAIPDARAKLRAVSGGAVMDAVARGDADLTIITVPNIVGAPGVVLVGLLPEPLQSYTSYVAAVAAGRDPGAPAYLFLGLLKSQQADAAFERRGFDRRRR